MFDAVIKFINQTDDSITLELLIPESTSPDKHVVISGEYIDVFKPTESIVRMTLTGCNTNQIKQLNLDIEGLKNRIEQLEAALELAIEDIQFWGDYVSEYFKKKHGFAECIDKALAALGEKNG